MRIFENFGRAIEVLSNTILFTILAVIDGLLTFLYFNSSKNLVKPSGLVEAIQFLFQHAEDYASSLFSGTIAFALTIIIVIVAIINLLKSVFSDSDDSKIIAVLKVVAAIILIVTTSIFLKGTGGLALSAVVLGAVVYCFVSYK